MFSSYAPQARALRASDADREHVATALRDHAAEGRLSMDELGDRLGACYGARTVAELDSLLWDLPQRAPVSRVAHPRTGSLRTASIAIGVVMALTVLPGVVFPALGLAVAGIALVLAAVFLLVPVLLLGAGAWGVARLVRGPSSGRPQLR